MFSIREFHRASSLEEAWKLNQKRDNRIIGGMGWMKMQKRPVGVAIDLSALGLDAIEEQEDRFILGAMVTLRQLETDPRLEAAFGGAFREALRHIVGVQFRNCATIGGSVWMRFGFSDPLTLLLALDTEVCLWTAQGRTVLALEEFLRQPYQRDLLTEIHVKKTVCRVAYQSMRNTQTDFPVLAAAVAEQAGTWRAAIGARPGRARRVTAQTPEALLEAVRGLDYHSNLRASGDYRRRIAGVLTGRCVRRLEGGAGPC